VLKIPPKEQEAFVRFARPDLFPFSKLPFSDTDDQETQSNETTDPRSGIWIDDEAYVWRDQQKLGYLPEKPARRLLTYLVENSGRVCAYRSLYEAAYQIEPHGFSAQDNRAVDELVVSLCQLVEVNPQQPKYLEKIRDIGYRLNQ
jgi:DNA-binding response OmpR family regulator